MPVTGQRVPTHTCAKCKKKFKPGDRVITAFIVQKVGFNPQVRDVGAWLGEEFELVHVMCENTALDGQIIVPSGG